MSAISQLVPPMSHELDSRAADQARRDEGAHRKREHEDAAGHDARNHQRQRDVKEDPGLSRAQILRRLVQVRIDVEQCGIEREHHACRRRLLCAPTRREDDSAAGYTRPRLPDPPEARHTSHSRAVCQAPEQHPPLSRRTWTRSRAARRLEISRRRDAPAGNGPRLRARPSRPASFRGFRFDWQTRRRLCIRSCVSPAMLIVRSPWPIPRLRRAWQTTRPTSTSRASQAPR